MIRTLVLSFVFFGGIGYIVFQIFRFYLSLQGTRSQRKKDLEELKMEMSDKKFDLIKLDVEELKLLSLNEESSNIKSFRGNFVIGQFFSIYNEALFVYGIKEYASTSRAMLLIQAKDFEILYEIDKNKTKVFWNDKIFGIIDAEGFLTNEEGTIRLGKIDTNTEAMDQQIFIDTQVVAIMNNPYVDHHDSARAFSLLNEMDEYDRHICLSLGLLNLVQRTDMKKVY